MKTNPDVPIAGRIRTTPDFRDYDTEHTVLSLGLFPACYIQQPSDDRVFFRFEAAWDSSLHNSPLLNRVTASGERIYLTLSAYLEVGSLWHFTYKKFKLLYLMTYFYFNENLKKNSRKLDFVCFGF